MLEPGSVRLPVLSSAMWPQCEGHGACSHSSHVAGWGSPFVDVVLPGQGTGVTSPAPAPGLPDGEASVPPLPWMPVCAQQRRWHRQPTPRGTRPLRAVPPLPTDDKDRGPQEPHSKIIPLGHDVLPYVVGEASESPQSAEDAQPPSPQPRPPADWLGHFPLQDPLPAGPWGPATGPPTASRTGQGDESSHPGARS